MSAPAGLARRALARAVALTVSAALGAGCAASRTPAVPEPATALRPVGSMPALRDDADPASLRAAVAQSLAWLAAQPGDRVFVAGPRRVTVAEQTRALQGLLGVLSEAPGPERLAAYVREAFEVLEAAGGPEGRMLVTGLLRAGDRGVRAARAPSTACRFSAFPTTWWRFASRRSIPAIAASGCSAGSTAGGWSHTGGGPRSTRAASAGRGLELAWARDPVDVFFMEIQGSGTLRFPDGREQRVGYAGANGRAYRAIGRLLIDEGHVPREAMSMQAIREWLRVHPAERQRVLQHNESYVFFRPLPGPPEGSLGRPLTPGRSVATDARLFPPGALAFLDTEQPERSPDGTVRWVPLARFVLNQDTGGAIRGPGRVDFFWGRGEGAAFAAGLMRQPGRLYFLVPRPAAVAAWGSLPPQRGAPAP